MQNAGVNDVPITPSFFKQQPEHIQSLTLQLVADHTAQEVVEHLHTLGVDASCNDVYRFNRKCGVHTMGHAHIVPVGSYDLRTKQYIEAIRQHQDASQFSNKYIGLVGACWSSCAWRLQVAGLIKRIDSSRPAKYVRIATMDEIDGWYDRDVLK